jgi:hypothetical protein
MKIILTAFETGGKKLQIHRRSSALPQKALSFAGIFARFLPLAIAAKAEKPVLNTISAISDFTSQRCKMSQKAQ